MTPFFKWSGLTVVILLLLTGVVLLVANRQLPSFTVRQATLSSDLSLDI